MSRVLRCSLGTAAAAMLVAVPASAQLPSASTAALGMGDNFTAAARGYHAVAWNPAMLGIPNGPDRSIILGQLGVHAGLGPVTLGELDAFEGAVVDMATRRRWLERIQADGGESGTGGADVTWLAAQAGRFAVQVSSVGRAAAELSPGAAELFLFGNAGHDDGRPRAIDIDDSELHGSAVTTAALSYAQPFVTAAGVFSFGATVKYTLGHAMLLGENQGSRITADPVIDLRFPIVSTRRAGERDNGTGVGLDMGAAFTRGDVTIAATVHNVVNTFEWNTRNLVYRPGTALLDGTRHETSFEETAFAQAPAELRSRVADLKYRPVFRAGIAWTASEKLLLTADVHSKSGDATLTPGPKFHAGGGAQYRLLPFMLVRAGGAVITDGFQVGGGLGLELGPVSLHGSLARRGDETITMLTLLSTRF